MVFQHHQTKLRRHHRRRLSAHQLKPPHRLRWQVVRESQSREISADHEVESFLMMASAD
jgi:hypothetical protein